MKKLLNGILIILIILLITGCSHESKIDIDKLPEGQKEFFMQLEAVNVPEDYSFNQYYKWSSQSGRFPHNISGIVQNNKLIEPSDPEQVVKDSDIDEHIASEKAKTDYRINNDKLYKDALRMDQLVKIIKQEYRIKNDYYSKLYFGKVLINNIKCFSNIQPYGSKYLYICFNQDNQLVYFRDQGNIMKSSSVRWRLEGYELSSEQLSLMYQKFKDLRDQFRNAELNECEGACKESAYLELLENLRKPAEECFVANYSSDLWEETYFKAYKRQDIYFCNGSCVDCFVYAIDEKGEKYADPLAFALYDKNDENPEQKRKDSLLSSIEFAVLRDGLPKENFRKIILDDGRACFMAEEGEEAILIDQKVMCFDDNYLVNTYYLDREDEEDLFAFIRPRQIWEKEAYANSEEILIEAFNIDWMPE